MSDVKPTALGLRLDAPSPGDIVTVKVKHRPKQEKPAYGEIGFTSLFSRTGDGDEADNPQHYRMTGLWKVVAVNGGQAVVEGLISYTKGRREVWPIALHDWFEASELDAALNPPTPEQAA